MEEMMATCGVLLRLERQAGLAAEGLEVIV